MNRKRELGIFAALLGTFLVAYFLPLGRPEVRGAILSAFELLQWYAVNHTLACVVPALFIAGAITSFLSPSSVMRLLGPRSPRHVSYPVAAASGGILAVCSCSVLPMFAGIYRLGAGLGPATAFLYAGPAINVLAIFLTARVLGLELGMARAVGAVTFAVVIGLMMAWVFRREEAEKVDAAMQLPPPAPSERPLWKNVLFLVAMIAFLVFSDWVKPGEDMQGAQMADSWVVTVWQVRWYLAGAMGLLVVAMAFGWFDKEERAEWMGNTWDLTKMVVPFLFGGVFLVGFVAALLPDEQVAALVGDDSISSVFVGSVVGALFYFATLTEIPIVQALREHGMTDGPALALLLAGPAVSLPNILVIGKVMGWKKTAVFCLLVVVMAAIAGWLYGVMR